MYDGRRLHQLQRINTAIPFYYTVQHFAARYLTVAGGNFSSESLKFKLILEGLLFSIIKSLANILFFYNSKRISKTNSIIRK